MKQLLLICMGLSFLLSCNRKTDDDETVKENRVELTPFVVSEIMIKDTMQIKTIYAKTDSGRMSLSAYNSNFNSDCRFFSERQHRELRWMIWKLIRDPKSNVYIGSDMHPASKQELRDRVVLCDSVLQSLYDAEGKETISKLFVCDSTSAIYGVDKIRFYEARYFNTKTGMIEIETLGYSLLTYIEEKEARKELFYVFKDEDAMKKAKQLLHD